MSDIDPVGGVAPSGSPPLTSEQQQALSRLHDAATQFEGVFLEMVMNAMQDTVSNDSIFGDDDTQSQQTWQSMLNDERAQAMAKSGTLGIGKVLEDQLRDRVLSDAPQEAHTDVNRRIDP